jgi:acetoin utilization protein AcuB
MIIRNWMKRDPVTIHSDALISEARELIDRHGMRYLPVVDNGVLRGILRRRDLYWAATAVTATLNMHEVDYFHKRLKVKDLMVRMPKTIEADEPVESAMKKGAELKVSFFPVMEKGRLVGTVSYEEIFETFSQVLGVREDWVGITLEEEVVEAGTLRRLAQDVDETGAIVHSIFTLGKTSSPKRKVIVRLETDRLDKVIVHLKGKGHRIIEVQNHAPGASK